MDAETSLTDSFSFSLNGQHIDVKGVDPNTPLLHFLRSSGFTGTKEGCAEGECGACAIVVVREGPKGPRYVTLNSCLVLLPAVAGQELFTAEGLANQEKLHPVQDCMVKLGGSQCGYCTPGFVMSMFSEYYRADRDGYDPESISGNLCRCTGYRPIRDAVIQLGKAKNDDPFKQRLSKPVSPPDSIAYEAGDTRFFRPTSLSSLFDLMKTNPKSKLIAGGTELVVEVNQMDKRFDTIIALDAIRELRRFELNDDELIMGAGVPLSELEERLHEIPGLNIFKELFLVFSSRLIRNSATLGGNLVNASPIGDSPPVLLALGATVRIRSAQGTRDLALDQFFSGYKATHLKAGEIVESIIVPRPFPKTSRFYKVSKRIMDDISTVAAGFAIDVDDKQHVTHARLAYGGVAATPIRAYEAEEILIGKRMDPSTLKLAIASMENSISPMTDHRGSAAYRQAMLGSLLEKFAFDISQGSAQ